MLEPVSLMDAKTKVSRWMIAGIVLLAVVALLQAAILLRGFPLRARWFATRSAPVASVGWNPGESFDRVQAEIDRLFEHAFPGESPQPATNLQESLPVGDPFAAMRQMRAQVDMLFAHAADDLEHFGPPLSFDDGWRDLPAAPGLNVEQTAERYQIEMHLPNADMQGIRISVAGPYLTIAARLSQKRGWSSIERRIRLAEAPDPEQIMAHYANHVLTIVVPRRPGATPTITEIPVH